MRANELRIGNWVNSQFGGIQQVVDVMCDGVNTLKYEGINYEFIDPIPLTEEWLLKFGFRKGHLFDTVLYLSGTNWHLSFHDGVYQLNYKESHSAPWVPVCKDLKNVHQLQNLYFALTGEELTLKNEQR